jgi:WD40 repeat protein
MTNIPHEKLLALPKLPRANAARSKRRVCVTIVTLFFSSFLLPGSTIFAQAKEDQATLHLVEQLASRDVDVRRKASESLMRLGPTAKTASTALGNALQDPDQTVRYNAAQALGRIGPEAKVAIPALGAALGDSNKDVRQSSAWALGKIGAESRSVAPALIQALKDENKDVRRTAAWALAISGVEERAAVPVLLEALGDSEESNRETAARALGRIGVEAKTTLPALVKALEDPSADVRRVAATAIGNMAISLQHGNDVESIDQLRLVYDTLQRHSDRDVRDQAYIVQQAIDGLELARSKTEDKQSSWSHAMTIITVLASIAGIVGLLYFLVIGQKSIPEYRKQRRESRLQTSSSIENTNQQSAQSVNNVQPSPVDASTVLYSADKRLTCLGCGDDGRELCFSGFSQIVFALPADSAQAIEIGSHRGIVRAVRISPRSSHVASCGDDGLIRLTDLRTKDFQIIGQHAGPVYSVAFHPNGKFLASAGKDPVVRLWNVEGAPIQKPSTEPRFKGQLVREFRHRGVTLFGADFNLTGDLLAIGGTKGTTMVWNTQTGKGRKLIGFKETVFCVRFDPSGNFVGGSSADGTIRIWNLLTDQAQVLKGHSDTVRCITFHSSGKFLISASKDRTLRLWHLESLRCWVLEGHTDYVYGVEFNSATGQILSVSGDGTLRTWSFPSEASELLGLPR